MIEITVKDKTPELMQKLEAAVGRFVKKGADLIERNLILQKNAKKTGRRYPRGKDAYHIASAPGESPAKDHDTLYPSIMQVISENSLEAKIGTPVEYAVYLETGTKTMGERPLWSKTAAESLPTLENMLKAEIAGVK